MVARKYGSFLQEPHTYKQVQLTNNANNSLNMTKSYKKHKFYSNQDVKTI